MQKFTRPLTRETELAGERLAWTFSEQGIAVRPVGSRKPPREISWASLLCYLTGPGAEASDPASEQVAEAVHMLKGTEASKPAAPTTKQATAAPSAESKSAGPTQDLAALLGRLDEWFKQHRPHYHHGLLPGASAVEVDTLQTALGVTVPGELRTWLSWHNGQRTEGVGHLEQDWDLMDTRRIAKAKQELATDNAASGWQPAWIPFLADDQDNYLCLDTSQPGHPVRAFWQGNADQPIMAPSLTAWVQDFLGAVQRGAYHEDPERGSFLRAEK